MNSIRFWCSFCSFGIPVSRRISQNLSYKPRIRKVERVKVSYSLLVISTRVGHCEERWEHKYNHNERLSVFFFFSVLFQISTSVYDVRVRSVPSNGLIETNFMQVHQLHASSIIYLYKFRWIRIQKWTHTHTQNIIPGEPDKSSPLPLQSSCHLQWLSHAAKDTSFHPIPSIGFRWQKLA